MDELLAKMQSILSTPEGQQQLRNLQNMFGGQSAPPGSTSPGETAGAKGQGTGGMDLSALAGMLGSMGGGQAESGAVPAPQGASPDLSALLGALGGGQGGLETAASGIDMGMILKLQQVFQSMNVNDKNTQLLLALKPHFGEKRQAKVDQAISMMRLFSMLPMLQESGIFAGL